MKTFKLIFFLLLLFSVASVFGQRQKPAPQTELDEITARGKMLYEFDVAAWHSTDAVLALSPPEGSITGYVARKTDKGWIVVYGRLSEKRDKYLIAYETIQATKPEEFKVTKIDKPKEDTGFYLNAAKALETAKADFKGADRPYNFAVLPTKSDEFYVYILPAQTKSNVFPLGGDTRYRISKDGAKILERHQMHVSIIKFAVPPGINKIETGYHTAVLDDAPEDSDVFHVLTRSPKISELVVTKNFVYQIAVDGAIKYVMTTDAFKKVGKQ